MKVIKFAYYDEFHCTGSDCLDTCCQKWTISLTKREYLNYKKMDCSPELKSIINTAFKRIKEGYDFRYAAMKLDENGICPFLGEDHLCKIQKEKGAEALTLVCSSFPRQIHQIGDDVYIYACDITCSHVAELLINHPEGLALVEEEYAGDNPMIEMNLLSGNVTDKNLKGLQFFWDIKNAQLDILQNRNFTIPERMLILGFFAQKADEYIKNNTGEKISGLANMLLDNELCKKIADSLKAHQSEESAAVKSVNILYRMKKLIQLSPYQTSNTVKHFEQIAKNINLTEIVENGSATLFFDRQRYSDNLKSYRELENNRSYIIENILVDLAFTGDPKNGIWNNFFILAIFYNTLKVCIPAFLKEDWNDRDLALAITYAAKTVLNTHLADKGALVDFMNNNSFDLPHAAFLIN